MDAEPQVNYSDLRCLDCDKVLAVDELTVKECPHCKTIPLQIRRDVAVRVTLPPVFAEAKLG